MKIELIRWMDAGGSEADQTWATEDEVDADDNPIITSVGWVVKETPKNITISMDLSDDGQTHTRSRIPKGMIIDRAIIWGEGEDK